MSEVLVQQMKQSTNALHRLLSNKRSFVFLPLADKPTDYNLAQLNIVIQSVQEQKKKLISNIEYLQQLQSSCTQFVTKMTASERPAEITKFDAAEKELNITHYIDQAYEKEEALENTLHGLLIQQAALLSNLASDGSSPNGNSPQGSSNAAVSAPKMKLPTLTLHPFNGERIHWAEFWENFNAAIHLAAIPSVQKMTYLRSLLDGEAKKVIEGLTLSDSHYEIAINLLREKYGCIDSLIRELHIQLNALQPARGLNEVKAFQLQLEKVCRQLQAAGQDVDGPQVYLQLEQKIPKSYLREIHKARKAAAKWSTTLFREELARLVEQESEIEEVSPKPHHKRKHSDHSTAAIREERPQTIAAAPIHRQGNKSRPAHQPYNTPEHNKASKPSSNQRPIIAKAPSLPCAFCAEMHWNNKCSKFKTAEERKQRARELDICLKCLRKGHKTQQCLRPHKCWFCQENHPTVLCAKSPKNKSQEHANSVVQAAALQPIALTPLFMCRKVQAINEFAQHRSSESVLFIDGGAHRNFIKSSKAEALQLRTLKEEEIKVRPFMSKIPTKIISKLVEVGLKTAEGITYFKANTLPSLTAEFYAIFVEPGEVAALIKNENQCKVVLTEPDLLLGITAVHQLKLREVTQLRSGFHLTSSIFGPIVSGEGTLPHSPRTTTQQQNFVVVANTVDEDKALHEMVKKHQEMENIGIIEPTNIDHEEAQRIFDASLKFENGRYCVKLPWIEPRLDLPDNYSLAYHRLRSTMKNLQKKPEVMQAFINTINYQLEVGIIEDPPLDSSGPLHYLPYQAIVKSEKTTKVRMVFDASSKIKKHLNSLNDCLHTGPSLFSDLVANFARFRLHKIQTSADVEKAFHQIGVDTSERDVLRFLWLKNPKKPPDPENLRILRFTRLLFGLVCSPFLMGATIKAHLAQQNNKFADTIAQNLYYDNCFLGADTVEEAQQQNQYAKEVFQSAGMNLREFTSNDPRAVEQLDENSRAQDKDVASVLGIKWDIKTDKLLLSWPQTPSDLITKRQVLRTYAKLFDPMGFLSPTLLPLKLLYQKLWEQGKQWDDGLEISDLIEWEKITTGWSSESITIDRLIIKSHIHNLYELHAFADASKDAMAVCCYLRVQTSTTAYNSLIFAKNRIKPIKSKLTIPKLELTAVELATRTIKFVEDCLKLPLAKLVVWTDAEDVLHFLRSKEKQPIFVRNRLLKIKSVKDLQINYVPTADNPADVGSRGTTIARLKKHTLWLHGPSFLAREEKDWPNSELNYVYNETFDVPDMEEQLACSIGQLIPPFMDTTRFSKWSKLLTTTAFVLKFIRKASINIADSKYEWIDELRQFAPLSNTQASYLSPWELDLAEIVTMRQAQREYPPTEDTARTLALFFDENDLLRCEGRIANSSASYDEKYPIYFPPKCAVVELLVQHTHEQAMHGAASLTLSKLRERYWLPSGRRNVREILKRTCKQCRRFDAKPYVPPRVPQLPNNRVTASRPYSHVGLDYMGPFTVKIGDKSSQKMWVLLITCFVTRAVHLDLIDDYSAEAFIRAFIRFVSRYGKPSTVTSDNASNFKAAADSIKVAWQPREEDQQIITYFCTEKVVYEAEQLASTMTRGQLEARETSRKAHNAFASRLCQLVSEKQFDHSENALRAAQNLLGRDDVTARWIHNSLLEIRPCVTLSDASFTTREVEKCYDAVPVRIELGQESREAFLEPITKILRQEAAETPCRPLYFKRFNKYFQLKQPSGQITEVNISTALPEARNTTFQVPFRAFKALALTRLNAFANPKAVLQMLGESKWKKRINAAKAQHSGHRDPALDNFSLKRWMLEIVQIILTAWVLVCCAVMTGKALWQFAWFKTFGSAFMIPVKWLGSLVQWLFKQCWMRCYAALWAAAFPKRPCRRQKSSGCNEQTPREDEDDFPLRTPPTAPSCGMGVLRTTQE